MSKKMTSKPNAEKITKATEKAALAVEPPPTTETMIPTPATAPNEVRNGITKPKAGSICASIWEACDAITEAGQKITFSGLKEKLPNVNDSTIRTQRQRHKSFHV